MFRRSFNVWIVISFLFAGSIAAFEPKTVYLTWLKNPESTIVINWILPEEKEPRLIFDAEEAKYGSRQTRDFPLRLAKIYNVEITGLKPDTEYSFRFSDADQTIKYRFKTMPEHTQHPVLIAVGGDMMGGDKIVLDRTTKLAASKNPHFMIFGGDLAYANVANRTNTQRWINWLSSVTEYCKTSDGRLIPFVVAIGNHEVERGYGGTPQQAPYFYALFRLPEDKSYYRLDFKDYLSLIVLDTDHTERIEGAQLDWLRHTMANGHKPMHYFAVYHYPAYGTAKSGSNPKDPLSNPVSQKIHKHWIPLFEMHGIQVAFEHDHHTYKRTKKIKAGKEDPDGILYLGDGAWGVNTRPLINPDAWYLAKALSVRHFILATIHNEHRSFVMFDEKGEIIDRYPE